jgi:uncharacterized protein YndB with AHSA1/START domain
MGHEFEVTNEADVDATVDEVWQAIATGPGIDSWFMGRNEVANGTVRTAFGGYTPESPVTVSDPGKRFTYGAPPAPDGRFIAFDFLIEGRAGGSTSLRLVANGFLPGDDWAEEFEAMNKGGAIYFRTLVEYLNHFAGRTATPVTAFGPPVGDWDRAWARLGEELGLDRRPREGDRVTVGAASGVVYFTNAQTVGIRTADAIYRFVQGFHGPMIAMHNLFAPAIDSAEAEQFWQAWLSRVFA